MIISNNRVPPLSEFQLLMEKTDQLLNADAAIKEAYYSTRNGTELEKDVYQALCKAAENTAFERSIQLVSGASFPDIVARNYYGVEVKSTNKNHWKSIGSSILESTRNQNVKRIYLTFGKLGRPVQFKSRPYEECLSGISVTHYPRYQIDMELQEGETIFDKMGIPYDTLRSMESPVLPVARYYRSQLKEGESLWWANDENIESQAAPFTVRLWSSLSPEEKNHYTVLGYAFFPEILSYGNSQKYQRYALWLATDCGIINTNIRDQFSAGGQMDIPTANGVFYGMPATYSRILRNRNLIIQTLLNEDEKTLQKFWNVPEIAPNRVHQWVQLAAEQAATVIGKEQALRLLYSIMG